MVASHIVCLLAALVTSVAADCPQRCFLNEDNRRVIHCKIKSLQHYCYLFKNKTSPYEFSPVIYNGIEMVRTKQRHYVNVSWEQDLRDSSMSSVMFLISLHAKATENKNCFLLKYESNEKIKANTFKVECLPSNVRHDHVCLSIETLRASSDLIDLMESDGIPDWLASNQRQIRKTPTADIRQNQLLQSLKNDATLDLIEHCEKNRIQLIVGSVSDELFRCAEGLLLLLHQIPAEMTCKSASKTTWKRCIVLNHNFSGITSVYFGNLEPGNYCAKVFIASYFCSPETYSFGLHTAVTILRDAATCNRDVNTTIVNESSYSSVEAQISIGMGIMLGILVACFCLYIKYVIHVRRTRCLMKGAMQVFTAAQAAKAVQNLQNKPKLLVLYCPEESGLNELVLQFISVLANCFHCEILHIDDEAEIENVLIGSPAGWVLNRTNCADFIILVESNRAVQLQQEWIRRTKPVLDREFNYKNLKELVFLSTLVTIQSHKDRFCYNYEKVFVVKFDSTADASLRLEDVVGYCRYVLPEATPVLFSLIYKQSIHSRPRSISFDPSCLTNGFPAELHEHWIEKNEDYRLFLRAAHSWKNHSSHVQLND